jgi:hypothetical protein
MKTFTRLMAVAVATVLAGCSSLEREARLPLAEIPGVVKAAAEQVLPGLVLAEAEVETKDGATVYELEGTADGRKCELRIRADGTVLRLKQDDAED